MEIFFTLQGYKALLSNALIPMTRTSRLGADGAVAAHDLACAAAAEAFVGCAAIELGDMRALRIRLAGWR